MANQLGMVFAKLNCKPRWRERLPEIEVPTLVVHGRRDPFFPVGNGEAIAREIPGARLLVLREAATAIPDAAAGEVAEAMLTLGLEDRAWRAGLASAQQWTSEAREFRGRRSQARSRGRVGYQPPAYAQGRDRMSMSEVACMAELGICRGVQRSSGRLVVLKSSAPRSLRP